MIKQKPVNKTRIG